MKNKNIKVGFYVNLSSIESNTILEVKLGNPGIGGTQYSFLVLVDYLSSSLESNVEPYIFTEKPELINSTFNKIQIRDIFEAAEASISSNLDFFVFRPMDFDSVSKVSKIVSNASIKLISWMHNFLDSRTIKELYNTTNFYKNIFVSKGQMLKFYDNDIYEKSNFIYNSFPIKNHELPIKTDSDKKIVTYIGSINKSKGFHILAQNWKKILYAVPNAELHIIGSGSLYNSKQKLGKYNIAESSYEKLFMPFLIDKSGEIDKSVFFHGKMGLEKETVIKKTKLGICNPSGKTETFGITAIEFQLNNVPVLASDCTGYQETVTHGKTGYLFRSGSDMTEYIILLLKNEELRLGLSGNCYSFVEKKFDINEVGKKWLQLFNEKLDEVVEWENLYKHKFSNVQNIYLINAFFRKKLRFRFLPAIDGYIDIIKKIKNV